MGFLICVGNGVFVTVFILTRFRHREWLEINQRNNGTFLDPHCTIVTEKFPGVGSSGDFLQDKNSKACIVIVLCFRLFD